MILKVKDKNEKKIEKKKRIKKNLGYCGNALLLRALETKPKSASSKLWKYFVESITLPCSLPKLQEVFTKYFSGKSKFPQCAYDVANCGKMKNLLSLQRNISSNQLFSK